jgi:phosphodiesterase/alkaline phosphatase D-like protein
MENTVNVADVTNPETGLTFRQENHTLEHTIPLGTLVEVLYENPDPDRNKKGLRLFVVAHNRNCDGTPLYSLTHKTSHDLENSLDVEGGGSIFYRMQLSNGHDEKNLKVIRLPDGTYPAAPKTQRYLIHGSTGCSCCRNENFLCGIYDTLVQAMQRAEEYVKSQRVCSQYSKTGIYTVYEIGYEELIDGRIIIGNHIFDDKHSIYEYGNDIDSIRHDGKSLGHLGAYNSN